MTTGLRLFISSAVFAIVIAFAYWRLTHEIIGSMMLGFLAAALLFVAFYMIFAEREAHLSGDNRDGLAGDDAGVEVGVFTTRSILPLLTACVLAMILLSLVITPVLAIIGILAALGLGALFIQQSR